MTRRSALLRILFPDAALWVAFLALLFGVVLGEGPQRFFRDSDTGWHIRTGEWILEHGALPRVDPFSFTMSGKPWFAWEWGADVLMAIAHQWDGLKGVALLYALVIAMVTWLWFHLHWAVGGNFFLACAFASPMLTTLHLHWLARPHVLGWLFCLTSVLVIERFTAQDGPVFRWRQGAMAALAGMVWANVHGSFFLLPVLLWIYAGGRWANAWLWSAQPAGVRCLAILGGCGALGSLLNPYGWDLHRHVGAYLMNRELLSRIGEYLSFNFHSQGTGQILLTVILSLVGAAAALYGRRTEHFLIIILFAALAIRSARVLPLLALLGLPLANGGFTAVARAAQIQPMVRRWLDRFLVYSDRIRQIDQRCAGWAAAPAVLALAFLLLHAPANAQRAAFPPSEFPVQAATAVAQLPPGARLLAPDKFGGYLIYRFQGQRKVFFDGRSDFYGVDFMKNYIRLVEARPGWKQLVTEFGFTHALLPNQYSLVQGLEDWGWKQVYRDSVVTLLKKE
ncbi:MAG: hypothetical protein NZV14_15095 [Bryobacteraceae bacterium]|nr:hypothetical protein [Bryobacteraceae bacterium]MDW8379489.1 hypothetical protein [Bryobacterales bacterium]